MDPTDSDPDSEHVIYLFKAKSLIFCAITELLRKEGGNFSRDFPALVYSMYGT